MNIVRQVKKSKLLLLLTLGMLFVLSACNTAAPPTPTLEAAAEDTGFAFRVDPENEVVIPVGPTVESATPTLQAQADGDTRLLVQGEDIRFKDFSFQFKSPNRLVVRLRVENITEDLDFTQPFFFTLSSTSENIVRARAPLVTDAQLGGDGVLSPGETSKRFRFVVTFREDEPFTFFVDARAAVVERTTPTCTDPVEIPDENLEAKIRGKLDKPEGALSCEDLESLREFDATFASISDLEGLQYAVNLSVLELNDNDIDELSPIKSLTNLTFLDLNRNAIRNLSPLENLTGLTSLRLVDNTISDITPLENLTGLVNLGLGGNDISDITPLENLTNLRTLSLSGNAIDDFTPLASLTTLRGLSLNASNFSDLTPLENLTDLFELFLNANNISDLTPLGNLTNLSEVELANNSISDISALVDTGGFDGDSIDLRNNPLSPQALEDIETLRARGVFVTADEVPNACTSPVEIPDAALEQAIRNELGKQEGELTCEDLAALETLDTAGVPRIQTLERLQFAVNLRKLSIAFDNVTDLSPLENLIDLNALNLSSNNISEISALVANSGLGEGDTINLSDNPLSPQALEDIEILRARGVEVEARLEN